MCLKNNVLRRKIFGVTFLYKSADNSASAYVIAVYFVLKNVSIKIMEL